MIVDEPPYDLVVLFADQDAKLMFERIVERGQHRGCIRGLRWRSIRDPRRDASVARDPARVLEPFLGGRSKLMVVWDHEGSGREGEAPASAEDAAVRSLTRRGTEAGDVLCVALVPELEVVLMPLWERVAQALVQPRGVRAPSAADVVGRLARRHGVDASLGLEHFQRSMPKEAWLALVAEAGRQPSARLFEELGDVLSIPALKVTQAVHRVTAQLQAWFPTKDHPLEG
jgi:hypothetical protein